MTELFIPDVPSEVQSLAPVEIFVKEMDTGGRVP
jgi:hypothetical protein